MTNETPARRTTRAFLLCLSLALAGGCSDDGSTGPSQVGTVHEALLTDSATTMGWIEEIRAQGIRRPGYAADDWIEGWAQQHFVDLGLEDVTLDPADVQRWEPLGCSLEAWHEDVPDERLTLPC